MSFLYKTTGTCSKQISFDVLNNKLVNLNIAGGCPGNIQGLIQLTKNMDIDQIISSLKGIQCRNSTSCPDQLAKALIKYKESC